MNKCNDEMPLVSVCIPAYNSSEFIVETIKSIEAQIYPNIEIIVVDDNSTDNTWTILSDYMNGKKYIEKEIRLYKNLVNLGMSGNWNKCLEYAKGKYIKLICADDLIECSLIQKEVEIMESDPDILCVSTDTVFVDLKGAKKGRYRRYYKKGKIKGKEAACFSLFTRDYLGAPVANTFRKELIEDIGIFDTRFKYILDYDFFMRIYCKGYVYILHEPLNYFRIRSDSNTGKVMGGGQENEYISEHRMLVEKMAQYMKLNAFEMKLSVNIRKLMSFLGSIYLKIRL